MSTANRADTNDWTLPETLRKPLLFCGILAALVYVGSDILAAMRWEGYSYVNQSVSELRATGSPTRSFLAPILSIYAVLEMAFGVGIWLSAGQKRRLRATGVFLVTLAILDLSAYFFPMRVREEIVESGRSVAETAHIVGTSVTVLLIFLVIGFGANADGKWFRIYSYATIAMLVVAGILAAMGAPQLEAGLPTPWMGLKERANIYGYMLWMAMLAVVLLRMPAATTDSHTGTGESSAERPIDRPAPV